MKIAQPIWLGYFQLSLRDIMLKAATTPVVNSEDRMSGRACSATIVAVAAPVIATTVIVPTVVVSALAANLATQVAAVVSNVAALRARDRAVRTVNAALLPNLALALAQLSRLVSGELAGANPVANSRTVATIPLTLPERLGG